MYFANKTITRMLFRLAKLVDTKSRKAVGAAANLVSISLVRLLLVVAILTSFVKLGPSFAQNPLPTLADSWNGVHSYVVFSPKGTFTSSFIQSIAPRYDFGWSIGGTFRFDFEIGNPAFANSLYTDGSQGPNTLSWYQQNHPDWILTMRPRHTPAGL